MSLLKLSSVERIYHSGPQTWKLGPVSFSVEEEEEIAIMGPSGSGKSTLLHLIGTLDEISKGEIFFKGQQLSSFSSEEQDHYRNREIGFVFQDFFLMPEFLLWENVAMSLAIAGESRRTRQKKAEEALEAVGLGHRGAHFPHELSGGERQRGAIARALIHKPRLLLADEPTGNLDAQTGAKILELLKEVRKRQKITLLIVTHDQNLADMMERTISLQDGKLVSDQRK